MRIGFTAQDGLDGFGHDGPCVVKVLAQLLLVEDELPQAFQRTLDGDDAVSERYADVAQYSGIREVALQAAHRQLLCQELQDGVGYPEVSLAVLVVDGVHLVRHGA